MIGKEGAFKHDDQMHYFPLRDGVAHREYHKRLGASALERTDALTAAEEAESRTLWANTGGSIHDALRQTSFANVISLYDFSLVVFYVDWCAHCRLFRPTWSQLVAEKLQFPSEDGISATPVTPLRVNCGGDLKDVCRDIHVLSFPTLRLYRRDGAFMTLPLGTLEDILSFLRDSRESRFAGVSSQAMLGEGCEVKGNLHVPRAHGFFHLTVGHSEESTPNYAIVNLSHTIGHFSFGDSHADFPTAERLHGSLKNLGLPLSIVNHFLPLDGKQFFLSERASLFKADHHLTVTLTKIRKKRSLFQIAQTSKALSSSRGPKSEMPHIRFSYDFLPTAVVLQDKTSVAWDDFPASFVAFASIAYICVQRARTIGSSTKEKAS
jgi:hypothetical protein